MQFSNGDDIVLCGEGDKGVEQDRYSLCNNESPITTMLHCWYFRTDLCKTEYYDYYDYDNQKGTA
jgi:hypothetical protein